MTPVPHTPIPDEILSSRDLSASLIVSYGRLRSAAWRHAYRCTEPLDIEHDLRPLLGGISRSNVLAHLKALKLARLIAWTTNGNHKYIITFLHLFEPEQPVVEPGISLGSAHQGDVQAVVTPGIRSQSAHLVDAAAPPNTTSSPNVRTSPSPDFQNLGLEEDEEDHRSDLDPFLHHHLQASPKVRTSGLQAQLIAALQAGRLDQREAEQFAGQILAGEISLTLRDVLENVAYVHDPDSPVEFPASIMRIHVRAGRRAPRGYRLPFDDFDEALRQAQMTPVERDEEWRRRSREVHLESGSELVASCKPQNVLPPVVLRHPSLDCPIENAMLPEQVWQAALGEIQLQMSKPTFETWVKSSRVLTFEENGFKVGVPSTDIKDWLDQHLLSSFKRSLAGILGGPVELTFVVVEPA